MKFLLILFLIIGFWSDRHPFFDAEKQSATDRVFDQYELTEVLDLTYHEVYRPGSMAMSGDRLFIYDISRNQIVEINLTTNESFLIGSAGRGPGEYLGISKLILHDQTLVAFDPRLQKILYYDVSDFNNYVVQREVSPTISLQNFCVSDNTIIGTASGSSANGIFATLDHEGEILNYKEVYPNEEPLSSMIYSAELLKCDLGPVYISYNSNIIKRYSKSFDQHFSVETIDQYNKPELKYIETEFASGHGLVRQNQHIRSAAASDEFIYVVVHNISEEFRMIDQYDLNNGVYTTSIKLPFNSKNIVSTADELFVVIENNDDHFLYEIITQ